MEKTFDVIGVPNATLIFRGIALMPNKKVHLVMTEKELNSFSKFLCELEYTERTDNQEEDVVIIETTPIAQKEPSKTEEKPQEIVVEEKEPDKEKKQNDKRSNRGNKATSKKQISVSKQQ